MATLVVNAGKAIVTNRIRGAGTEPLYVSWGTGAGTTAAADTTLFTEAMSTSNNGTGNTRVTGTTTQQTTTVTNDTWQCVGTLTADAAKTITNAGCFDTNGLAANLTTAPSGGNLFPKGDFAGLALNANDSIQFTFKVSFA